MTVSGFQTQCHFTMHLTWLHTQVTQNKAQCKVTPQTRYKRGKKLRHQTWSQSMSAQWIWGLGPVLVSSRLSAPYYAQAVENLYVQRPVGLSSKGIVAPFLMWSDVKGSHLVTDHLLQKSSFFKGLPGYQFWVLSVCAGSGNIRS